MDEGESVQKATNGLIRSSFRPRRGAKKLDTNSFFEEVKVIDANKYIKWQETVDEIGRQLGGWIRSTKER